jgi:hypothetical protein
MSPARRENCHLKESFNYPIRHPQGPSPPILNRGSAAVKKRSYRSFWWFTPSRSSHFPSVLRIIAGRVDSFATDKPMFPAGHHCVGFLQRGKNEETENVVGV